MHTSPISSHEEEAYHSSHKEEPYYKSKEVTITIVLLIGFFIGFFIRGLL